MTLPVQPADRFFLLFDAPPPVTCCWSFTVEGAAVEPARLRSAVERALTRHPKAALRLRRDGGRLGWEHRPLAGSDVCVFEAPLEGASEDGADAVRLAAIMSGPLAPERDPLLRLHWIPAGPHRARLVFRFHHALSDGAGSLGFLRAVLDAYNGAAPEPVADAAEPAPLVAGGAGRKLALLARLVSLHARRSGGHAFAPPARLYDRSRRPSGGMGHAWRRVSPPRLARLRVTARGQGAGMSEMLLAAFAMAAERSGRERGLSCGVLRISVTQDLRPRRAEPRLENRSSAFPVWIGPRERRGVPGLVRSLRGQLRDALRARAASATALFAALLRLPPPVARRLLLPAALSSRVADSCAFANLGALPDSSPDGPGWFHLGPARFAGAHAVVRPAEGLGAIASAVVLDGTLEVGLSYLTGLFSPPEADRYVELMDAALDELSAAASPAAAP